MEESEHLRVFSEMLEGRSPAVGMAGGDSQKHSIWLSGSRLKVLGATF